MLFIPFNLLYSGRRAARHDPACPLYVDTINCAVLHCVERNALRAIHAYLRLMRLHRANPAHRHVWRRHRTSAQSQTSLPWQAGLQEGGAPGVKRPPRRRETSGCPFTCRGRPMMLPDESTTVAWHSTQGMRLRRT